MARNLLTSPGVAYTYRVLRNTWNALPETYQQRVYRNTLSTVKRLIQQVENPTPAVVISMDAGHVDNAIVLDYLTSEVVVAQPEIRSTDVNIPIDNKYIDDKQHFGIPVGSGDFEDQGDASDERNIFPMASRRRLAGTEQVSFVPVFIDVYGYEGNDGDYPDVNEEEAASQVDDWSTKNMEDWKNRRFGMGTGDIDENVG